MLTENGREQIKLAARRLKDEPIEVIVSSDLTRAYQTAEAVAEGRGIEVAKDKALREIYGGDWENVPWDELPVKFPESYGFWLKDPLRLEMPNGETMVAFQTRVRRAVEDLVTRNSGKVICVATHGTVIKALLCGYHGKTLSELPDMLWHDNASVTVVEFDDALRPTVVLEGENAHLGGRSTLARQSWWRKKLIEGND
jgi:probable phosphoglycerate mutase